MMSEREWVGWTHDASETFPNSYDDQSLSRKANFKYYPPVKKDHDA